VLNTPGKQNGWFVLDVNGRRVIERRDVFYRDIPPKYSDGDDEDENDGGEDEEPPRRHGGLLGILSSDNQGQAFFPGDTVPPPQSHSYNARAGTSPVSGAMDQPVQGSIVRAVVAMPPKPVGFTGLFFR
jgi:hypothetical protein